MKKIYIIHENKQWLEPIEKVLNKKNLPFDSIFIAGGEIFADKKPPEGIFFSKISASSYTRGNIHSPDYGFALLSWLEESGCRIINGSSVLKLEISKFEQYIKLKKSGLNVPIFAACFGKENILAVAKNFSQPFIMKPNRGGKGIGVQLFQTHEILKNYLDSAEYKASVDNIMLIQAYIHAPEKYITRLEFIAGKFVYAVKVDTSQGFELCPAEACRLDVPAEAGEFCATNEGDLFTIIKNYSDPIIQQLENFLMINKIEVAGIEFIRDKQGKAYVYDINTNTNYNLAAEEKAGISALDKLAEFLGGELKKIS